MNESIKKLLVFIGFAAIVGVVIYVFSLRPTDNTSISDNDSPQVKEFKGRCDSIKLKRWSQEEYKDLTGALMAMKSNDVFNASDASNLQVYLNQAYASTLKDSCSSWLTTSGNDADRKLLSEMENLSGNPECSKMLSSEIKILRAYFSALQMPSKIRSFINEKYSLVQYNRLISEINSTASLSEIRHFSKMSVIASNGLQELSEFKKFAESFDGIYAFYNSSDDIDRVDNFKIFCPNQNPLIRKYPYYLQQLNMIEGACN